jgi:hypothetical protein
MTEVAAQEKNMNTLILEKIVEKKQEGRADLVFNAGFSAAVIAAAF